MDQQNPQMENTPPQPQPSTPQAWLAAFWQTNGREASAEEFQQAIASGQVVQEPNPSIQQMTNGAQQFVEGMKGFYSEKIAPTVGAAAESTQKMIGSSQVPGGNALQSFVKNALFILPATAFVGIIALFLPIASMFGISVNFFTPGVGGGHGPMLVILMLLVMGTSIATFFVHEKWMRITAGITGIVSGLIVFFGSVHGMVSLSSSFVSVGFGLILLVLVGLVLAAAGVLVLLGLRVAPSTQIKQ